MKSLGRGWVVLSLPTRALLCLPVPADFYYCSVRPGVPALLHNPELGGHSLLCGPALALFRCLCLAASFLIPALREECPCPSRDRLSRCLGLQPWCPSSCLMQLSRAWSKAGIPLHSLIQPHFRVGVSQFRDRCVTSTD